MPGLFLDPNKSLSSCELEGCGDCELSKKLVCHFSLGQLLIFLALSLPVFIAAGYVVYRLYPTLLIPWILFNILFFGFIEIRVLCAHCPHYGEPAIVTLKCWANYGMVKVWKYRPGPMSLLERLVFYLGFGLILAPPLILLLIGEHLFYALIYTFMGVVWRILLGIFFCDRCINLACPLNRVDKKTRKQFLKKNPSIAKYW